MLPTVEPRITLVEATPLASVVVVGGANDAPFVGVALQLTFTPAIGNPSEPSAVKLSGTGRALPRLAVWLSPATPVTELAPGPLASPPQASPSAVIPTYQRLMRPPLFRHHAIERLTVPDHAELLARDPFLYRRIRLEIVRELAQRVELDAERRHPGPLIRDLAPDRDPIGRPVLSAPGRERHQADRARDAGDPGPGHRPYRCRPG